jgi:hypothetical protein
MSRFCGRSDRQEGFGKPQCCNEQWLVQCHNPCSTFRSSCSLHIHGTSSFHHRSDSATPIISHMWHSHTSDVSRLGKPQRSKTILLNNFTLFPFFLLLLFSFRNAFSIPKSFPTSFPIFLLLFRKSIRSFLND